MKVFLKDEYTEINYSILIGGTQFPLDCFILESGIMGADEDLSIQHPKPTFNRIFLILQGTMTLIISGQTIKLNSKNLYLLPVYHPFHVTYHAGCKFLYFHFNIQDITGLDIFREIDDIKQQKDSNYLYHEISSQYFEETLLAKVRWQSALFQSICSFLTPQILSQWKMYSESRKYRDLLNYIQKNCHPHLTVTQLSNRMNISRSALSKGFCRQMGFPIKQYIQHLLMQKACRLLIDSNDSILEIAYKLGYNDPYYFYRVFKKHMLETPLQYRKASHNTKLTLFT
jgi:AraC-like DNA-binding protein